MLTSTYFMEEQPNQSVPEQMFAVPERDDKCSGMSRQGETHRKQFSVLRNKKSVVL